MLLIDLPCSHPEWDETFNDGEMLIHQCIYCGYTEWIENWPSEPEHADETGFNEPVFCFCDKCGHFECQLGKVIDPDGEFYCPRCIGHDILVEMGTTEAVETRDGYVIAAPRIQKCVGNLILDHFWIPRMSIDAYDTDGFICLD